MAMQLEDDISQEVCAGAAQIVMGMFVNYFFAGFILGKVRVLDCWNALIRRGRTQHRGLPDHTENINKGMQLSCLQKILKFHT